jgi:hypothetical protein
MTQYRTVQLPLDVHADMNALKIRIAGSSGKIPSNGDVVRCAIRVSSAHYDELLSALSSDTETESES